MPDTVFLKDLVIVLGAAVVVVALLERIKVPIIAGFILSGALIGPGGLGFVRDTHEVELLAEIGVVLLLFGIGLELSLDRLRRFWKVAVFGGALQVGLTISVATLVGYWAGLDLGAAIFLGSVIAVSSTAIVLRGLSKRGELEAPHGQLAVGILVFQDLSVIPMILAIPFLAGEGGPASSALLTLVSALALLGGVLIVARLVAPALLAFVARTRERELFILCVFLICLGTAWAVSTVGVSLALGAFVAGLVVAGSEYRHQALTDIFPARHVLASLFFVSIGMLLDVRDVLEHLAPTLGLLALILAGKFIIVLVTAMALRLPMRVGILTATALFQVGEFSFVLLQAGSGFNLLDSRLNHIVAVAVILSMLVTPVALTLGPYLASGAGRVPWLNRLLGVQTPGFDTPEPNRDHVIIAGYGLTGHGVSTVLKSLSVPFVVVDLGIENVRRARVIGDPVLLGDVSQPDILEQVGVRDARLMVVAINDLNATIRTVRAARGLNSNLPIVVRTLYVADERILLRAGATEVISAEVEAADTIESQVRGRLVSER